MKLLLACTSGGHFATMRALEAFWQEHERTWITDPKGDTQWLSDRGESVHWLPFQAPRDLTTFLKNLPGVVAILWRERPDVVVSTGASLAVSVAIAARLLGIRFLFVECISRVADLSLSGRLVYPLASEFYVQSPQLCDRYTRAEFRGIATHS
ncbi:MAG: UDP-N-acetylglucosamine--LPS N-acetylglucosamine transferase [Synechococcales cyanobacterium RM1_1_8]|nr:UDP-N-acetylglucosamine--LPS N-acetylglucosamine transferase [Synechococcales cyanobacterium RM1_1_8]